MTQDMRHMIVSVQLWNEDKSSRFLKSPKIPSEEHLLIGELAASGQPLQDDKGNVAFFIPFANLSVRCCGTFTLKFSLYDLSPNESNEGDSPTKLAKSTTILDSVFSEPFTVYKPEKFPGVSVANELTNRLREQGVKFVNRKHRNSYIG